MRADRNEVVDHCDCRESGVMSSGALFLAVFLACVVEAVEALTIVLAAGTGCDWRSAISGVVSGIIVLAVVVAVLGPALTLMPRLCA